VKNKNNLKTDKPTQLKSIRDCRSLESLLDLIGGENFASIIEGLRNEVCGSGLAQFFFGHKNSLVRFEVAKVKGVTVDILEKLASDKEQLVRIEAKKQLRKHRYKIGESL